jgi:hypothetical protein
VFMGTPVPTELRVDSAAAANIVERSVEDIVF